MKQLFPLLIIVAILFGVFAIGPMTNSAATQNKAKPMSFEYNVLFQHELVKLDPSGKAKLNQALNKLGKDGWELIDVTLDVAQPKGGIIVRNRNYLARENRFYFKRVR